MSEEKQSASGDSSNVSDVDGITLDSPNRHGFSHGNPINSPSQDEAFLALRIAVTPDTAEVAIGQKSVMVRGLTVGELTRARQAAAHPDGTVDETAFVIQLIHYGMHMPRVSVAQARELRDASSVTAFMDIVNKIASLSALDVGALEAAKKNSPSGESDDSSLS